MTTESEGNAPGIPQLDGPVEEIEGVRYIEEQSGEGAQPQPGQRVTVHYTGWLVDGSQFDSSRTGRPFSFNIATGSVIEGWDVGVSTMRVGGRRRLIIPSELGYGPMGYPPVIPPRATLIFDVELLAID